MPQSSQTTETHTRQSATLVFAGLLVAILVSTIGWNWWRAGHSNQPAIAEYPATLTDDTAQGVTLQMIGGRSPLPPITLEHRAGMHVSDAMAAVAKINPHWRFEVEGSGDGAFLTELSGLPNETARPKAATAEAPKYWQYEVNGERADVSFGAYRLAPGDRVLWKFAPYE